MSDYLFIIKLDKFLRTTNISYFTTFRVLEQTGFLLNRNIYYNIRSRIVSVKQNEFIELVIVLKKTEFVFKYRIEEEIDSETSIVINK